KSLMHLRAKVQIVVAISLLLSYAKIEARQSLSMVEDLELERQLKLINKPAIKTIKMKPTLPNLQGDDTSSNINSPFTIGLKDGGCPTGTVPIRRITKDDLIRQRFLSQIRGADESPYGDDMEFSVFDGTNSSIPFKGGRKYATVQIPYNSTNKITGAGAIISLHNPQNLSGHQFSAGRIKVQIGIESIQVGWIVNPHVYGDTHTRLYIYLKTEKLACFNTRCPGFIHINTAIPLDGDLPASTYGGPIYDVPMYIARDMSNGNWWFKFGTNYTSVGFWPSKIFTKLNEFATSVEYGGIVYSPPGVPEPSMGGGYFPVGDLNKDGYCKNSTYLTDKNETKKSLDDIEVKLYANSPNLYRVADFPNSGVESGNLVLYGGPGEHMYKKHRDI
uniref:Neprosin PEP catalytic domain-containing protein n=2 Tax=Solanum lycopersicum TaxID=4081 RepID=A0A3Q7HVX9_SOLLC